MSKWLGWLASNVILSVVISLVVTFFAWFFVDVVLNLAVLDFAEVWGKLFLLVLSFASFYDVARWVLINIAINLLVRKLDMTRQEIELAMKLGLPKIKNANLWTKVWVQEQFKHAEAMQEIGASLVRNLFRNDLR